MIENIIVILSVIGLVWSGIFIGREFGSFEKFFLWYINGRRRILPPYDDGIEIPTERLEVLE